MTATYYRPENFGNKSSIHVSFDLAGRIRFLERSAVYKFTDPVKPVAPVIASDYDSKSKAMVSEPKPKKYGSS